MQAVSCDTGDIKQGCPCLVRTAQNFLALYKALGTTRCISSCCELSYSDNTESPPKINTEGEARDRPAHKSSEVAPEELIWPLMFKNIRTKDWRAGEKQH